MNNLFSLTGRSFSAPAPSHPLLHVRRTLFLPYVALFDGSVTRLILSNHHPVRNTMRVQLFNVQNGVIPVRWVGTDPQADLVFGLEPFATRFIEIDGKDCPDSFHAWVKIEMTAVGTTGYALTTNPTDLGATIYHELTDGTETCARFPFDCEQGKITHFTLINCTKEVEAREFMFQYFFANAPTGENLLVKVPSGHAISVVPEMAKIRDHSGVVAIRAVDDQASFVTCGFWFHPGHQRGVLPTLPGTGSNV